MRDRLPVAFARRRDYHIPLRARDILPNRFFDSKNFKSNSRCLSSNMLLVWRAWMGRIFRHAMYPGLRQKCKPNWLLYGQRRKRDLFAMKLKLGVSVSHSKRIERLRLANIKSRRQRPNSSGGLNWKPVDYTTIVWIIPYINRETCKVRNLLQPFELSFC